MLIMGLSGGLNLAHEDALNIASGTLHDAAAVLVRDGEVIAAIEEERLDRIKHSNKFPVRAIRACLDAAGVTAADVDCFAYYGADSVTSRYLRQCHHAARLGRVPLPRAPEAYLSARALIADILRSELDIDLGKDAARLRFVRHHVAHATSAFAQSGFERALVLTIDGVGDGESGMVLQAQDGDFEIMKSYSVTQSLGFLYLKVIQMLGFRQFDEYKVMGLAPYGDPARYRRLFRQFYALLPEGDYALFDHQIERLRDIIEPAAAKGEFPEQHRDIAAALQETLETIVFHVVDHYAAELGHRDLCVAGGVAHNCTLNGKLLESGRFERVFVQPSAHDAGCALGAALFWHAELASEQEQKPRRALEHVYWGTDIGDPQSIAERLKAWSEWVYIEPCADVAKEAARLMAEGRVIGWAQGKSEFGPRALGNRSILADPRPASHKDLINAMVKKREGFRPFAPAVMEEHAREYFSFSPNVERLPFMIFVVGVHPERQSLLGAVTHVDGSARVQTVSRQTNPRFWALIKEFAALTGVPVVLNTSFNNNAEPIVDDCDDAVACFLTTQLDQLVIGDFVVSKRPLAVGSFSRLAVTLPAHVCLKQERRSTGHGFSLSSELRSTADASYGQAISTALYVALGAADGVRSLGELLDQAGVEGVEAREAAIAEAVELWTQRLIVLRPEQPAAVRDRRAYPERGVLPRPDTAAALAGQA